MSMWCLILSGFLKIRKYNIVTVCDQVITPLIALIVLAIMKGNVDGTIGYLIFRVLEGFESIYVIQMILGTIGAILIIPYEMEKIKIKISSILNNGVKKL